MPKNKNPSQLPSKHSRHSSKQSKYSQPRLSLNPTPPKISTKQSARYFLSNPNSLQKKKPTSVEKKRPKVLAKKGLKLRKKVEQPTQETIASTTEGRWKEHLKLTFRSKPQSKESSLHSSSLKCLEQLQLPSSRRPAHSFTTLLGTFPQQQDHNVILSQRERLLLMDWLNYVCSQLLCRRNTFHMAAVFIDSYLHRNQHTSNLKPTKLQALAAGALLLAVKQEERGSQTYVLNVLISQGTGLSKQEVLGSQSAILLSLQFKLNFSTISFWCDYFSQKWDKHILNYSHSNRNKLIFLRDQQGQTYKQYSEMMQLSDALAMCPLNRTVPPAQLALAVIYLIARVESQALTTGEEARSLFISFQRGFKRKASPIFNDPYNFNSTFNNFLTQTCDFQITQIIAPIKEMGAYLNIPFCSQIDSRAYEEAVNYQQFIRYASYYPQMRLHLEEQLM